MKKAIGAGILMACLGVTAAFADTVHVQVRSTALRDKPKAWAAATATVNYGDELTITGAQDGWMKVKTSGGKEGFVHPTALTTKKVVLSSRKGTNTEADRSDIVLAGKGFSKDVEKQYAAANAGLNFKAVDEVEHLRVGAGDLAAFIKAGKLNG